MLITLIDQIKCQMDKPISTSRSKMNKISKSQNVRCKNDELQQITRQNDKMKTQDEKTMNYVGKTTCTDSYITNDVKKMRKQFSRRRSAD